MMDQNQTTGNRRLTELPQVCSSTAENRSHDFGMCGIWQGGGSPDGTGADAGSGPDQGIVSCCTVGATDL